MRAHIRSYLVAGLLVILPLAVTFLLLRWLFTSLDSILQPIFEAYLFGRRIPGVGLVAGILLILFAGALASNVLGRRLIDRFERLMLRIPLARVIYPSIKEFSETLFGERRATFQRVVLIEWPRQGLHAIGFVTGGRITEDGRQMIHVFVPGTPNPTAGFVVMTDEREVRSLDLTVEEALKFVISGGIVGTPEALEHTIARRRQAVK
jgi:uncharacterized membrane protein